MEEHFPFPKTIVTPHRDSTSASSSLPVTSQGIFSLPLNMDAQMKKKNERQEKYMKNDRNEKHKIIILGYICILEK